MTLQYLLPEWPNKPNSSPLISGQKTCPGCRQFDDTCRIFATSFTASVDVTNGISLSLTG